jgi:ubiquinone/menaquinone biosynthesis C-methylase UbiE
MFSRNPFKIYEFEELKKDVEFSEKDQILDLGCGSGLQTLLLGKTCQKVIGIDISENVIADADWKSKNLTGRIACEFLCTKLGEANFENESFDKVFSICVIEHIANHTDVLKEIHRILKAQGKLIISVDSLEAIDDDLLIGEHKVKSFVEEYFSKGSLQELLLELGFSTVHIYPIFRSAFAKNMFIKGIRTNFRLGWLSSILNYFRLTRAETRYTHNGPGIFLIAKCTK